MQIADDIRKLEVVEGEWLRVVLLVRDGHAALRYIDLSPAEDVFRVGHDQFGFVRKLPGAFIQKRVGVEVHAVGGLVLDFIP